MPLSDRLGRLFPETNQARAQAAVLWLSSRLKPGVNVFSREWDLLVILDTCRVDALEAVAPEYEFLPETVPSTWSVGSSTMEWVGNTFVERYRDRIAETAVVSANQQVHHGLSGGDFPVHSEPVRAATDWGMVDESTPLLSDPVWQYAPTDPLTGLPLPEWTTDRAVGVGRDLRPERCLVHYLPPHEPYRATALSENRPMHEFERDPWGAIQSGTPKERVWERYLDELRWGLDHVEVLLANYDAETAVITADHGELFGEWGLYAHSGGIPHPHLRKVPWVETTATDTGTYEPTLAPPEDNTAVDDRVQGQMEQLGYL